MVKGISKQVIVVESQDRKLFDQAIFILSDEAIRGEGVTDEMLLKEANRLIRSPGKNRKSTSVVQYIVLMFAGAFLTGIAWLLTSIL